MPRPDAREVAFRVLTEVERGAFADASLGRHLSNVRLGRADRRLATLLVYGTLARQLTLDHTLAAYSSRGLEKISPDARVLLRLGVFQLTFLDRVPEYAAVDTTVRMAKRYDARAAGFVNALLRRVVREGPAEVPRERSVETDREGWIANMSIVHSHPEWLVAMWLDELGAERTEALLAADNEAAPTVLRALVSPELAVQYLADDGIEAYPARWAPDALTADRAPDRPGAAVAQSEASQLVVLLLDPQPGENVLDACAAPGGKTAYIAACVGGGGSVTAVDNGRDARDRIERTLGNAGFGRRGAAGRDEPDICIETRSVAQATEGLADTFDAALVDAPCSGLGTLRGHPEIRWRRQPEDLADLASRQTAILAAAARTVRPGGRLVYSTCTIASEENDAVVDQFLAAHDEWSEDTEAEYAQPVAQMFDARGRMRTFPDVHDTDGFFAVLLRRRA